MIKYEDECCGCATESYPCLGNACPNRNVPHMYCDACGEETSTTKEEEMEYNTYMYKGKCLCFDCLLEEVGARIYDWEKDI